MRAWTVSKSRVVVAVVVALSLGGVARAEGGGVKVATDPKLGKYLADDKGMALYFFKKDTPGKSACAGECVAAWPAFHAEKIEAPAGLNAADFKTITRDDGKKQTTYKDMPLYYWIKDEKPGDTTGHGVKNVWVVAQP